MSHFRSLYRLLRTAVAAFGIAALLCAADGSLEVYLVGTGGPEITAERAGASTAIRAGGETLLFDAGRHTLQGLYRAGLPPQSVTKVLLTHLHNDHIEGLPSLWITPWFLLRRQQPLEIWGPPGTRAMVEGMRSMFAHDIEKRANDVLRREYLDIVVNEIGSGAAVETGAFRIEAFAAEHNDGNPSLSYRIIAAGRTVLLTGDTTLTPQLLENSKGADVVVANVAAGTSELEASGTIAPILNKLLRPEQAARLFSEAKPKLAVYSHIVKKRLAGTPGDAVLMRRTRAAGYRGPLQMGVDGMRIAIGDAGIKVHPAPPANTLPELDGSGAIF
jgi:ribonuclease Z